jgi:hypothetical protein
MTQISELDDVDRFAVACCINEIIDWLPGFDGTWATLNAHLDEMRAEYGDKVVEMPLEAVVSATQALMANDSLGGNGDDRCD